MLSTHNYETNYASLPFEDVLREYRERKIWEVFQAWPHRTILEIGSGPRPLFTKFNDFDRMVVIEPGDVFFREAQQHAAGDARITVMHNLFENVIEQLKEDHFDIIVVGGFLHEIDQPGSFVQNLRKVCKPQTIIHTFVPNAHSFHRVLAYEMGLIESIFQKSDNDQLFERRTIFDQDTFRKLFTANQYDVLSHGTYFVKPFTHLQMDKLMKHEVLTAPMMDGLDRMIKYMPDLGAEIFVTARLTEQV